ncbi:hypothetical protein BKA67DRAFT_657891 [Truncatella angustata]|uniref:DUF7730 domain-containing protein n=1 Tax=Truncatella angustata TaxID=152316 RepID=A0A9P8UPJ7_9PEZI|nr:uncharacterized protein BKA67DRAFT_657891 [Truncatella angustata]KAH6655997.1 hypothetical protein BKA67DRAFT_657891 [Truncatella angustata]KAH8200992.1 hypothetical protein TruAng_004851 [Truncatella angustata]
MVGIRKWIRSKLDSTAHGKGRRQGQAMRDDLPFLPLSRPRGLTPVPSSQDIANRSQSFYNYGLFRHLPYELRRQILINAFGGQTLHLDLTYARPLVRKLTSMDLSNGIERAHYGLGSELVVNMSRSEGWQWFSCVCHRRLGYSESEIDERHTANKFYQTIEPCDDQCLKGLMCDNGQCGSACFVGTMGWILACRQAYVDGIEILYSTNTFHISSMDIVSNIPRLLPHSRLSSITSLELLWQLNSFQFSKGAIEDFIEPLWKDPTKQDSMLHTLCAMIPDTFPHVRRLYISFQCELVPPSDIRDNDNISKVESIFLGPVEQMLRILGPGRGKQFNVAIQRGGWYTMLWKYYTLLGTRLRAESSDGLMRGKFWKSLCPSGNNDQDVRGDYGYWICAGWWDMDAITYDHWIMSNWGCKWVGPTDTF